MTQNLSISVNPRGTGFVKLGKNHRFDVLPESIRYNGDLEEFGCLSASWVMKVNPLYPHYDLEQFTPVVIEDGGVEVWSGRIISSPTNYSNEGIIYVEAQGWGQHTKDDCSDFEHIISSLSRWKSARDLDIGTTMAKQNFSSSVSIDDSAILFTIGRNSYRFNDRYLGHAILDLGNNNGAIEISIDYLSSGINNANHVLEVHFADGIDLLTSNSELGISQSGLTSGNANYVASMGYRYVHVILYFGGTSGVASADGYLKFTGIKVATKDEYLNSSGDSTLTANLVIEDALDRLCPLYNRSRGRISATVLALENFPGERGFRYANELIKKANSFHGYSFYLTPESDPIPVFEPLPTDYEFVVGAGDDYEFKDPARNDGREVYNRVITEYKSVFGLDEYETAEQEWQLNRDQFVNNSFTDAIAGNWQAFEGTITRHTGNFDSSPASLQIQTDSSGSCEFGNLSAMNTPLKPRSSYKIEFKYRPHTSAITVCAIHLMNGSDVYDTVPIDLGYEMGELATGSYHTLDFEIFTDMGADGIRFDCRGPNSSVLGWIDSIKIYQKNQENIINRRGFTRTALRPIGTMSTSGAASAIAGLELEATKAPAIKGELSIAGRIRTKNGGSAPVNRLPSMVGKAVLLEQFSDPNTGAHGRQGIIYRAEYDHATDTASVEIDNPTNFITNLRARLGY